MAAIFKFKMAADMQHSRDVTLLFWVYFELVYNISKGISGTLLGLIFAPSNHTNHSPASFSSSSKYATSPHFHNRPHNAQRGRGQKKRGSKR